MSGKDFSDLVKRTYQELEEIWRVRCDRKVDAVSLGDEWFAEHLDPRIRIGICMVARIDPVCICARFLWIGCVAVQEDGTVACPTG